ncbi:WD-40 repeat-containing protein MSI4-like [Cynara cardunculus var. scolymus]|uniref:WD-40 repeat-containing protein MSI4-like n=1 Tax=Cynara cardunculus var. scolymus TaxID=59895 RepID=UPI000D6290FB|nr:WD-40 repeat-containing protein MSI4-like [Cynara cardunculus var. scolymus]
MEEASSPLSQPKKRGRPKGSKKITREEREISGLKMRDRASAVGNKKAAVVDEKYNNWKSVVPILYDWLANHNLVWPSLSCRWGPLLEQSKNKNKQRLYLSEQTDGSVPNTLVIANCDVVKPKVAAAEHISQFNEEARSPFVKKFRTIIHPGEVNRIRELPQNKNIVATHTDCPEVLIWDIEAQPNRYAVLGAAESHADLVLTGHSDNAEFALAMCPSEPYVLSGGKDKYVVLWSIHDHISTLGGGDSTNTSGSTGSIVKSVNNASLGPRGIFQGHEDTVEDVQFCPTSTQEFCSVGDDSCLILWDARVGTDPVMKVEKAHNADVHCVDWSPHDENYILTGSADHSVCMFDRRNLTSDGVASPVHKFEEHRAPVLCVQWCPDKRSVFGSSAEDSCVNIWDYEQVGKKTEHGTKSPNSAPGLFFKHCGHRDKVVDFHWNVYDPWTVVSVSDDVETTSGGGTLQIWRMSDLIYRPRDEVLTELEDFKAHVATCGPRA